MTFNYTLSQEDYLSYQLYNASRSALIRKKRRKARNTSAIIFLITAVLMLPSSTVGAVIFLALSVLWFFGYPYLIRYQYKQHCLGLVKEQFSKYENRSISFRIEEDFIYLKDSGSEIKFVASDILEISELQALYIIKIKTGNSILISKQTIGQPIEVGETLKLFAVRLQVPYHNQLNWQWK
jgi:hypothetical protein